MGEPLLSLRTGEGLQELLPPQVFDGKDLALHGDFGYGWVIGYLATPPRSMVH